MGEGGWVIEGSGEVVDLSKLKDLQQSGELAGRRVRPEGSDNFLTPEDLDDLVREVTAPPVMDTPLSMPPVMAEYPRAQAQPVSAKDDPMRFVIPVNPSGWAVAAGYLGLLSTVCVFAPLSLVAGILALRDLKANPQKTGKGRAWFGLIMGTAGTIGLIVMLSGVLSKQ